MCFDKTTSLVTFSISVICFLYLLHTGIKNKNNYDIFAATVTILIGVMQAVEYFLWQNQTPSKINHLLSLLIIFALFLQPIIGGLVYMYLFSEKTQQKLTHTVIVLMILYTIFVFYLLDWLNKKKLFSSPEKKSCRLAWAPFVEMTKTIYSRLLFMIFLGFYFLIGLYAQGVAPLLHGKIFEGWLKYPVRYAVLPFTFILTLFICFLTDGDYFIDIIGSFWCFMAVVYGVVSCFHV
jgi:hypothetical protein